jgi:hypothetical protein
MPHRGAHDLVELARAVDPAPCQAELSVEVSAERAGRTIGLALVAAFAAMPSSCYHRHPPISVR